MSPNSLGGDPRIGAGGDPARGKGWGDHPAWILLAPLVVLLICQPALQGAYLWDDARYFREDSIYRDPARFWTSLSGPFVLSPDYYRPLTILTFLLEMQWHGLDPALSHGINAALHALNASLVGLLGFLLLRARPGRGLWALAMALCYGAHPAAAEGVGLISGRFDLMMTGFLLLALLAELRLRARPVARAAAVSLLFLGAALCKESAAAFLPVLPLWRFFSEEEKERKHKDAGARRAGETLLYGGILLSGLAYLLIRFLSLGYLLPFSSAGALTAGPWGNHLLLVLKSAGRYVALFFWPYTLVRPIHYSELPVPLGDWQAWIAAALLSVLLFFFLLLRRGGRRSRLGMGFCMALPALLPVLNIVPLKITGGSFAADRYLIFPLALFILPAGIALSRIGGSAESRRRRPVSWALYLMLVLGAAGAAEVRWGILPRWRDGLSLWSWAARTAPLSPLPHTNLSGELYAAGDYEGAIREARRSLALSPDNADALSNLGSSLLSLNRMEEAIAAFERAVQILPGDWELWSNLSVAYRGAGRLDDSIRALKEHALVLNPDGGFANFNLGVSYQEAGHPDLAVPYLEKSIPLLPPAAAEVARRRLRGR
jgi:protein O-mannosyl-transferase